jgi:hypothetical protein
MRMPNSPEDLDALAFRSLLTSQRRGGSLGEAFVENHRIVAPDSPAAKRFHEYALGIASRLRPEHSHERQPVRFLVSDPEASNMQNAYVITEASPVLVCFTRALLLDFRSEDELAFILGHELAHLHLANELGDGPNSKTEEYASDILPIQWLHDAGYAPRAALDMAQRLFGSGGGSFTGRLAGAADEHGLPAFRVDAIRAALFELSRRVGELKTDPTPIGCEFAGLRYESRCAQFLARHPDFDDVEPRAALVALTPEFGSVREGCRKHYFELADLLRAKIAGLSADDPLLVGVLDAALGSWGPAYDVFYAIVANRLYPRRHDTPDPPLGRLAMVAKWLQRFIDSQRPESATKAAKRVASLLRGIDHRTMKTLRRLDWPRFSLTPHWRRRDIDEVKKEHESLAPPWETHLAAAQAALEENDSEPFEVLWLLGVPVRSLITRADRRVLQKLASTPPLSTPQPPRTKAGSDAYVAVVLDSDGWIVDYLTRENAVREDAQRRQDFLERRLAALRPAKPAPAGPAGQTPPPPQPRATPPADSPANSPAASWPNDIRSIPPAVFFEQFPQIFDHFASRLLSVPLKYRATRQADFPEWDSLREEQILHFEAVGQLVQSFRALLRAETNPGFTADPEKYRQFVRGFFVGRADGRDVNAILEPARIGLWKESGQAVFESLSDLASALQQHHPLLNYAVLQDPDRLLPLREKIAFIAGAARTLTKREWKQVLAIEAPRTYDELRQLLSACEPGVDSVPYIQRRVARTVARFAATADPSAWDIVRLISEYPLAVQYAADCTRTVSEADPVTGDPRKVERNVCRTRLTKHVLEATTWPDDPATLVSAYRVLDRARLFPGIQWRTEFVDRMIRAIRAEGDVHRRIALAEQLLLAPVEPRHTLRDLRRMKAKMEETTEEGPDLVEMCRRAILLRAASSRWHDDNVMKAVVRDRDVREAAIAVWLDDCAALFGIDEGTQAYLERTEAPFRALIGRVCRRGDVATREELFSRLANRLETQEHRSYELRDAIFERSREQMLDAHLMLVLGEQSLSDILNDSVKREATVRLLAEPLTEQSSFEYAMITQEWDEDRAIEAILNGGKLEYYRKDPESQKDRQSPEEAIQAIKDALAGRKPIVERRRALSPDEVLEEARGHDRKTMRKRARSAATRLEVQRFYEGFWHAPLSLRILVMDQLLRGRAGGFRALVRSLRGKTAEEMRLARERWQRQREKQSAQAAGADQGPALVGPAPDAPGPDAAGQDGRSPERAGTDFDASRVFDYVVSRVFPLDMEYAAESRTFVQAYLDVVPEYERGLFLAALLAAGHRASAHGEHASVGKRLAMLLEYLGPAERKLGQAIHSHPQTPHAIRHDMARLKSQADPPTRWQLIERLLAVVPDSDRSTLVRVGELKGSASYFTTVAVEREGGVRSVMVVQRPHARQQAVSGFRRLRAFVQRLRDMQSTATADGAAEQRQDLCDTILEIVDHAEHMAARETDSRHGFEQVACAQRLYDGVRVEADGIQFACRTAGWRAFGDEFREQEEMPGVHFNDLSDATPEERRYKKAVAKACIAIELRNIFSGGAFDHDRHGAQLRIDTETNAIGMFDHGAMHLLPLEAVEKAAIARAVTVGLACIIRGDRLHAAIHDAMKAGRLTGDRAGNVAGDCLVRVQRALLQLTDFTGPRGEYVSAQELAGIVFSLWRDGHFDGEIVNRIFGLRSLSEIGAASFAACVQGPAGVAAALKLLVPGCAARSVTLRARGTATTCPL